MTHHDLSSKPAVACASDEASFSLRRAPARALSALALAAVLLLAVASTAAPGAAPPAATPAAPAVNAAQAAPDAAPWGQTQDGLRTRLAADARTFRAGHTIPMKLEVENTSKEVRQYRVPQVTINGQLQVIDADGRPAPYVGGSAQTMNPSVKLEAGRTRTLESFDLASWYYLRKPGRYTVVFPGDTGWGRLPGDAADTPIDTAIPPSNKLQFEVTADPAATADGDPVGRLLPLARDKWSIAALPDAKGKVRPGGNREEVAGRQITFLHNPTGLISDCRLIWLWLTDAPAAEQTDPAQSHPPPSEYLGKVSRWHVYFQAPPEALKRWPAAKEDLRRALAAEPK